MSALPTDVNPDMSAYKTHREIVKKVAKAIEEQKCMDCGEPIKYEADYCCDGFECGCRGLPIEPPLCEGCWCGYYNNRHEGESNPQATLPLLPAINVHR